MQELSKDEMLDQARKPVLSAARDWRELGEKYEDARDNLISRVQLADYAGVSQSQLARDVGVTRGTVIAWLKDS